MHWGGGGEDSLTCTELSLIGDTEAFEFLERLLSGLTHKVRGDTYRRDWGLFLPVVNLGVSACSHL